MDRKNRVKLLINKLWKTRQIQAAFGMQAFRGGLINTLAFGGSESIPGDACGNTQFARGQKAKPVENP
jgi:hypothetical protein